MSAKDLLRPPRPRVTGIHKRNLALLAGILLVALGVSIWILTAEDDSRIVKTEPKVPRQPPLPPRALLEEPPEPRTPPPDFNWTPPRTAQASASSRRSRTTTPREDAADKLLREALRSPVRAQGSARASDRAARPPGAASADFLDQALRDLERQQERVAQLTGGSLLPGTVPGFPAPATAERPALSRAAGGPRLTRTSARWRIAQGTVLDAQLLTAIDSQLPGQIVGQLTRDVFDSGGFRAVLIPRGSKLLGRYDEQLVLGQNRILVEWHRILFPDGASLDLPAQPGVDAQGRSGLRDRVNHHFGRIFGQAALLSLIGAGFELSQGAANESTRSRLAIAGASRELELAATELLRQRGSQPPTIRIRAGMRFQVLLNRDLEFPEPYHR